MILTHWSPADKHYSDDSKPTPSKPETTETEHAELAEVIEKSKTEVSEPNGDHEVPGAGEDIHKDTDMEDAPIEEAKEKPASTDPAPTAPVSAEVQPAKIDNVSTQVNELTEAPVVIDGSNHQSAENSATEQIKASEDVPKAETNGTAPVEAKEDKPPSAATNGDVEHDTPASVLEKGLLYFLFRSRVGVDEPQDVNDIARSYMVLRPLPHDAKIGDPSINDSQGRLIAIPKKLMPTSGRDRYMCFVEKAKTSFGDLKNTFSASEYETKTMGTRHIPAMTPVGEGVYAITTTGRESHLAYVLTLPEQLSEVQHDIGLKERGSFIISTKNPQFPSSGNASLPQKADYSQDILDDFRGLRWMPSQPKHLDYANAQFLIIGESSGLEKATEAQPGDEKKDTPLQEMEKLEDEDQIRVKHLRGMFCVPIPILCCSS